MNSILASRLAKRVALVRRDENNREELRLEWNKSHGLPADTPTPYGAISWYRIPLKGDSRVI